MIYCAVASFQRRHSRVPLSHVGLEVALLVGAVGAVGTCERFLSGVDKLVTVKITASVEGLGAVAAVEHVTTFFSFVTGGSSKGYNYLTVYSSSSSPHSTTRNVCRTNAGKQMVIGFADINSNVCSMR